VDHTQQLLFALGLDVFPGAVPLAANGGQRRLDVDIVDHIELAASSTGTRYFVTNPAVASVSSEGLMTGHQPGDTTITIINGPAEYVLPVRVEVPRAGPVTLGQTGGIVQGSDGSLVGIAPGALKAETQVAIAPAAEANLPVALPGPFQFVGGFQLDVGQQKLEQVAQVAIPVPTTLVQGTKVYFFRYTTLPDLNGVHIPVWLEEEVGIVGSDGFARTTTEPYPGVSFGGIYAVGTALSGTIGSIQGSISTEFPTGLDASTFFAVAPIGGGAAIGALASLFGGFILDLPVNVPTIHINELSPLGGGTILSTGVQVIPDQVSQVSYSVLNTFIGSRSPSESPLMTTARLDFSTGTPELILTGERFTFANPGAPPDKRDGSSVQDLTVNFRLRKIADPAKPHESRDVVVTARPLAGSTDTELRVAVPAGVMLGLTDMTVIRPEWVRTDDRFTHRVEKSQSHS
jgi:hypothetical protein